MITEDQSFTVELQTQSELETLFLEDLLPPHRYCFLCLHCSMCVAPSAIRGKEMIDVIPPSSSVLSPAVLQSAHLKCCILKIVGAKVDWSQHLTNNELTTTSITCRRCPEGKAMTLLSLDMSHCVRFFMLFQLNHMLHPSPHACVVVPHVNS